MTLRLENLRYSIGGATIVRGVSGSVEPGEIVALVGPNGAGKSTLASLVAGYLKPEAGTVTLRGIEVTGREPEKISQLGLARMFQSHHLAWNLTAKENLLVSIRGWEDFKWWKGLVRSEKKEGFMRDEAQSLLNRVGLGEKSSDHVRELSFGQLRLLALARALAHSGDYLLLDEPFSGLKDSVLARVVDILREERDQGKAILLIDHLLSAIRSTADRVWFMHEGKMKQYPDFETLRESKSFVRHYLGIEASREAEMEHSLSQRPARRHNGKAKRLTLEVRGLVGGYPGREVLSGVDLKVGSGEIVGIVGANGCGKSTLLRAIVGLANQSAGSVALGGQRIDGMPTHERIRMGLRFLPQDGRLLRMLTVEENLLLSESGLVSAEETVVNGNDDTTASGSAERDLLESAGGRLAGSLSGGEQARLAFRCLDRGTPLVFLLDEPTAGIDAIARERLRNSIQRWVDRGKSAVIVEHDIKFLGSICNKLLILQGEHLKRIGRSRPSFLTQGLLLNY